jgi:hypothetical protein
MNPMTPMTMLLTLREEALRRTSVSNDFYAQVIDKLIEPRLRVLDAVGDAPLIYVSTPLMPREGDPGWPLGSPTEQSKAVADVVYTQAFLANTRFAEECCHKVALAGAIPYAPHLLFTRFLNDAIPEEREIGLRAGLVMAARCDELLGIIPSWRTEASGGMKAERDVVDRVRIPARFCADAAAFDVQLARLRAREPIAA